MDVVGRRIHGRGPSSGTRQGLNFEGCLKGSRSNETRKGAGDVNSNLPLMDDFGGGGRADRPRDDGRRRHRSSRIKTPLGALLVEVRGLRSAIEQMASVGPSIQLAMGRLQLQEQRINTLVRRGDVVRDALTAAHKRAAELRDRFGNLQRALEESTEPQTGQILRVSCR